MRGEIFPRNVDVFHPRDAVNLQFTLVSWEKAQAFLEQEADDQQQDHDGEACVRSEEILEDPIKRESLAGKGRGELSVWSFWHEIER